MIETGERRTAIKRIKELLDKELIEGPKELVDMLESASDRQISKQIKKAANKSFTKFFTDSKGERYITIINKNGDPMTFKTKDYAELVAQTRITDSQTTGTIETGLQAGVEFFQITAHNSPYPCGNHELNIITANSNFVGVPYTNPKFGNRKIEIITREHGTRTSKGGKPIASMGNKAIMYKATIPSFHPRCKHRLTPLVVTSVTADTYNMQFTKNQKEIIGVS